MLIFYSHAFWNIRFQQGLSTLSILTSPRALFWSRWAAPSRLKAPRWFLTFVNSRIFSFACLQWWRCSLFPEHVLEKVEAAEGFLHLSVSNRVITIVKALYRLILLSTNQCGIMWVSLCRLGLEPPQRLSIWIQCGEGNAVNYHLRDNAAADAICSATKNASFTTASETVCLRFKFPASDAFCTALPKTSEGLSFLLSTTPATQLLLESRIPSAHAGFMWTGNW